MPKLYTEADINLALSDIALKQFQSVRSAAAMYNIPESTLRARCAGRCNWRDSEPNSKRMTKLEEEVIVKHILDESLRGLATLKEIVWDMVNKLLVERGGAPVGKN